MSPGCGLNHDHGRHKNDILTLSAALLRWLDFFYVVRICLLSCFFFLFLHYEIQLQIEDRKLASTILREKNGH